MDDGTEAIAEMIRKRAPWYQRAEMYAYIDAYGHSNAKRNPKTGIDFLDQHVPRICDRMPPPLKAMIRRGVVISGTNREARDELGPRQAEAARLYWQGGLSQEAIAVAMQTTQQAISALLIKASKKLNLKLDGKVGGIGSLSNAITVDPAILDNLPPGKIKAVL